MNIMVEKDPVKAAKYAITPPFPISILDASRISTGHPSRIY
eukprot:COSAG05_NODE_3361_length_2117_cov_1.666006_3_plen_41_part_00